MDVVGQQAERLNRAPFLGGVLHEPEESPVVARIRKQAPAVVPPMDEVVGPTGDDLTSCAHLHRSFGGASAKLLDPLVKARK